MDSGKDTNRYEKSEETQITRFGEDDGVGDTVILFLLFFSIFPLSSIKPELIGWENARPIKNTFKAR